MENQEIKEKKKRGRKPKVVNKEEEIKKNRERALLWEKQNPEKHKENNKRYFDKTKLAVQLIK